MGGLMFRKACLIVPSIVVASWVIVGSAGGAVAFPTSAHFGGTSGSVDTPAKVVALLRANTHDSTTQVSAVLNGLSPTDRAYVIKEGYMPAYSVESVNGTPVAARGGRRLASTRFQSQVKVRHHKKLLARHKKVLAHIACVHPNYNWSKSFQFRLYNPIGWTIYEYQSNWQWGGGCDNVVYAHHQETSTYTMPGWVYNGSTYGAGYGRVGTHMVGRETFGHFAYVIDGVVDNTVDQQVQVNGTPGWWWWAKATGFGT